MITPTAPVPPPLAPACDESNVMRNDSSPASQATTRSALALEDVTILIVEDEASIAQLVRLYLEQVGARVLTAADGLVGVEVFERERPDLVILDLMLPTLDGWQVFQRMRQISAAPILMLTARGAEDDRVRGLDLGADDYVIKPFSPRELVSRVRAILRRSAPAEAKQPERLAFPSLLILPEARRVEVDGQPTELTAKEFDLLVTLARVPGRVLSRQTLFSQVWGFDYLGDSRTVDVHVGTLRKKIEGAAHRHFIETIRSVGYRFDPTGKVEEA